MACQKAPRRESHYFRSLTSIFSVAGAIVIMRDMRWLFESWYLLIPPPWIQLVLAPMAAICGGLIGIEREAREKPAGVRTMSLVCLGACIFTLGGYSFTTTTGDSGRVAAQIVTGIGFLGAGMLFRGPSGITGVTTAATVWVVAAMGIIIGTGHVGGGLGLTVLIIGLLRTVGAWERTHFGGTREVSFTILFDTAHGKSAVKIAHALEEFGVPEKAVTASDAGDSRVRWAIRCHLTARPRHSLLLLLADMPEVLAIEDETIGVRPRIGGK